MMPLYLFIAARAWVYQPATADHFELFLALRTCRVAVVMFIGMMFMVKVEVDHETHTVSLINETDGTTSSEEQFYFDTKATPG
jgi:hypothetical protein